MSEHMQQPKKSFSLLTEVKFEEEDKSIPIKCWSDGEYINVKLNIKGSEGRFRCKMDPEYASLFLEKAIPAILEKESTLIEEYLRA
jgi:hypothetical protein